jgi:molybdenum storage protein
VLLLDDPFAGSAKDPKTNPKAAFIKDIRVTELKARNLPTLPFDRVLIDLLACARQ